MKGEINMELKDYQMIGQGNTAEIYRIEDKKVLKLFRPGFNRDDMEREYQNSVLAQNTLDCVPRVYEKVEVDGRDGIIYEEISGQDMLQLMLKSPLKIAKISKEFARYHYAIQKPVDENLVTVKEKLFFDIDNGQFLSEEAKIKLRKYMDKLPDGEALCHFDFHPGNVMIVEGKPIILDWMTVCKGDICADAARTSILLKYGQIEHASAFVKRLLAMGKKRILKNYCKEYSKLTGISMGDIAKWELPIAAARLRESIPKSEREVLLNFVNKEIAKLI